MSKPAPATSHRVITIPNILSLFRLSMVPVFLILVLGGEDIAALIVLAISSVTDFLDGAIARRFDQSSRIGQLLDPAADRLFILATIIGLAVRGVVPWWLLAVVVLRDVLLIVLALVLAGHGFGPLPVHHLGKVATFCLFVALPLVVVGQAFPGVSRVTDPVGWAHLIWGTFLYWWAGVVYLTETVRVVRIPVAGHPVSDNLRNE